MEEREDRKEEDIERIVQGKKRRGKPNEASMALNRVQRYDITSFHSFPISAQRKVAHAYALNQFCNAKINGIQALP